MPFPSFHLGKYKAIESAGRILKETRCQAVKLEGGVEQAEVIGALVSAGIPVMAHCGLRPQNIQQLGGYRVHRDEPQLLADARAAEQAGAFAVVLECIPAETAARLSSSISIPTIGIGAGVGCDGQILVFHDLLGLNTGRAPRHAKAYANLKDTIVDAVTQYRDGRPRRRLSRQRARISVGGAFYSSCPTVASLLETELVELKKGLWHCMQQKELGEKSP